MTERTPWDHFVYGVAIGAICGVFATALLCSLGAIR